MSANRKHAHIGGPKLKIDRVPLEVTDRLHQLGIELRVRRYLSAPRRPGLSARDEIVTCALLCGLEPAEVATVIGGDRP